MKRASVMAKHSKKHWAWEERRETLRRDLGHLGKDFSINICQLSKVKAKKSISGLKIKFWSLLSWADSMFCLAWPSLPKFSPAQLDAMTEPTETSARKAISLFFAVTLWRERNRAKERERERESEKETLILGTNKKHRKENLLKTLLNRVQLDCLSLSFFSSSVPGTWDCFGR